MYLLYAPENKFGKISPKTPLISEEVIFTNNIAFCPKYFWKKYHVVQGCRDITPHWMVRMRRRRDLNNILIRANGGIGDVMWCMPYAKALRQKYPRSRILVATDERAMPVFAGVPYIDTCVRDEYWNLQSLIRTADEVYEFGGVATVLKESMKLDPIEAIFKLGDLPLPKNKKDCRPMLVVTIDEGKRAEATLKRESIDPAKDKIITIALESSTPNRNWPYTYTKMITEALLSKGKKVIWLSEKQDFQNTYFLFCDCGWEFTISTKTVPDKLIFKCPQCGKENTIEQLSNPPGLVNLCGKTDIRTAMATIALSDVFVGPNSGLMVIATSLDIPTVGLFGAFNPRTRAKFYDKFIPICGKVPCAPCDAHWTECEKGHPAPCMKAIQPGEVYKAIEELLRLYPREALGKLPIE